VLTWKSWLVLTGAAVSMGVLQHYLWQMPTWLAALIVAADLTLIAAGLLATIPGPAARGTLVLLAVPAYPAAVYAVGISGSFTTFLAGFPNGVFLPTIALAVPVAVAVWRHARRRRSI
jgi:hypothetical protein